MNSREQFNDPKMSPIFAKERQNLTSNIRPAQKYSITKEFLFVWEAISRQVNTITTTVQSQEYTEGKLPLSKCTCTTGKTHVLQLLEANVQYT